MLNGIYPPLPTPFHDDGSLALDGLRVNVERLNATGLSGYVALGSNSEAVHVSPDEASQVFAIVRKTAAPDKQVIGGTGQFSTRETIAMTKRAADAGCDAALIVTPFYYKNAMTADALRTHYHAIADQSPIPIMIYNVPANTGFNIASSIVAEIAQHPNVIGIKDSAGDINQLAETVRLTRSKHSAQRAPDAERRTGCERSEAELTPGWPTAAKRRAWAERGASFDFCLAALGLRSGCFRFRGAQRQLRRVLARAYIRNRRRDFGGEQYRAE